LPDGRQFDAEVVGTDRMTDVALLKIDGDRLHPADFGDSDNVDVGHVVLAIGSPFRFNQTVSHGIISAKGRTEVPLNIDYQDFIQTDAPINPGNSGGPLVNTRGQVIGIITAIATESGAYAGVGFATPSNRVVRIANLLKSGQRIERGYLGVEIRDTIELGEEKREQLRLGGREGVYVGDVRPNHPADRGGLAFDDVVLKVDGSDVGSVIRLQDLIAETKPGAELAFLVWRDGRRRKLTITVGAQPKGFSTRGGLRDLPTDPDTIARGNEDDDEEGAAEARRPMTRRLYVVESLGLAVRTLRPSLVQRYDLEDLDLVGGVVITRVDPGSAARSLGLKTGEVIVSADGRRIHDVDDLRRVLERGDLSEGIRARIIAPEGRRRSVILQSAE
ncbi:MAG: trypsin-like peptidase domain-containing protein, partial [Phycisphaerae bacterium]